MEKALKDLKGKVAAEEERLRVVERQHAEERGALKKVRDDIRAAKADQQDALLQSEKDLAGVKEKVKQEIAMVEEANKEQQKAMEEFEKGVKDVEVGAQKKLEEATNKLESVEKKVAKVKEVKEKLAIEKATLDEKGAVIAEQEKVVSEKAQELAKKEANLKQMEEVAEIVTKELKVKAKDADQKEGDIARKEHGLVGLEKRAQGEWARLESYVAIIKEMRRIITETSQSNKDGDEYRHLSPEQVAKINETVDSYLKALEDLYSDKKPKEVAQPKPEPKPEPKKKAAPKKKVSKNPS